jgi:nitronate monooxygenase
MDVREALHAGAAAVAVGTAVLRTPESGASTLHKTALANPQYTRTTLTRAFTGRPARGLVNQFVLDHDGHAPVGYPALHHLTRPLRAAASRANDHSAINLWAGEGWRAASDDPVAEVLARLEPPSGSRSIR